MNDTIAQDLSRELLAKKARAEFFKHTGGEDVAIRVISGTIYGFTTEIGALRLFHAYRYCKEARFGYSQNLKSFYFSLEPRFVGLAQF